MEQAIINGLQNERYDVADRVAIFEENKRKAQLQQQHDPAYRPMNKALTNNIRAKEDRERKISDMLSKTNEYASPGGKKSKRRRKSRKSKRRKKQKKRKTKRRKFSKKR